MGRLNKIVREIYLEELGKLGMVETDEDDILVTASGCEVLSKDIIKQIEDIEAFMANR